jgi:NAD(P)-dependent dehydrogenase (short-subunit alcohol dehydrogenase family)
MSKIVVITGAGVGLGRALARRLAADGEEVVLLGRTFAKVDATAREIGSRAMAVACDVRSPGSVRAAFAAIAERHATIDVLVNNAALYEPYLLRDATDEQIEAGVATNLTGPIFCARSAIPMMSRGAHIINVSSEGVELPFPHMTVYQAAKAGLERFTASLYRELDADGIRVSFVRAGAMMEEGKAWAVPPDAARRFLDASIEAGLNPRKRPISQFASVTDVFRALIDLPPDVHALGVSLFGRAP